MFFTVILKMGLDSSTSSIGNWALVRFVKNPPKPMKTYQKLAKIGLNQESEAKTVFALVQFKKPCSLLF